jgi:hypothetical protein
VLGDIPGEVAKFAADPDSYLEKRLIALVNELGQPVVHAIRDGMGGVVGSALSQVGLRPLVDGIAYLAEKIDTIVRELMSLACVLDKQGNSVFWGLVAALVGARASGLVESKADCWRLYRTGDLSKLLVGPITDLVECAITVAFKAPLPSPRAVEHSYTGGGQTTPCVFAVLEQTQGPPQRWYLHWKAEDARAELDKHWADGWRFGQLSPYVIGGGVFCHYTLERTGADQVGIGPIGWKPWDVAAKGVELLKNGYHYTSIGSYVLPDRTVLVSAVWERTDFRPNQRAVFEKPLLWWQLAGKVDHPADHGDPNQERRPAWLRYVSPYVVDNKLFINAIIEPAAAAPKEHRRCCWDLPFAQFAEWDRKSRTENLINMYISPYVINQRLHVAALWKGQKVEQVSPFVLSEAAVHMMPIIASTVSASVVSPRLTLFGWRWDDFATQMPHLAEKGYRITELAGYLP